MYPDQSRTREFKLAFYERQVAVPVEHSLVGYRRELTVPGGKLGCSHPADQLLGPAPVLDQVGDSDEH